MQVRPAGVALASRQRKPAGHRQYVFAAVYLLGLYCWWMSCGFYFGVGGSSAAVPVQPESDPSLECQRMRVAYEVRPGRDWGKLTSALQARWKEITCDELVKETASSAPGAAAASAPIATQAATPAVPTAASSASASASASATVTAGTASTATASAAPASTATASSAAASAATAAVASGCPATRKPYHTLLTGQGTIYNGWQSRIMYYHWKKVAKRDGPCTEMTGFTRLCASKDGLPDGLEKYIPSVFVKQLTTEVLAKYGHFGVLNRPHSVVEGLKLPALLERITEVRVRVRARARARVGLG